MSNTYKEYSPKQFKKKFPEYWKEFPKYLQKELLNDDEYVIRTGYVDGSFCVELGYVSDNWCIV